MKRIVVDPYMSVVFFTKSLVSGYRTDIAEISLAINFVADNKEARCQARFSRYWAAGGNRKPRLDRRCGRWPVGAASPCGQLVLDPLKK